MSEIETTESTTVDTLDTPSKLGQWAQDARDAYTVARSLAGTAFVPKEMQGRPDLVTGAILTGQEIGLDPMASLRSIDIIQGVPAMRANTMRGLVQAAGHEVWVDDDSNETRAIVHGRRKGSDRVQTSTWSMDRARALNLANRDNYKKQPGAMLVARGTSEVCRLIAADVLLGMPYSIEELDDDHAPDEPKPKQQRKRTAKRKPVEPVETPPLEDLTQGEPTESTADESTDLVDGSTHGRLNAAPDPDLEETS